MGLAAEEGHRIFQSTSPVRGTTRHVQLLDVLEEISIHVPREGDDKDIYQLDTNDLLFQSTSPVRGTTQQHS